MAHVAPWKKDFVKKIEELVNKYPVVGIVNINNIPAPQMQKMRASLRENSVFIVGKNRLIKLALKQANKENVEELGEYIDGQTGIIFTEMNAFKLAKTLDASKTKAPAKGGEVAPEDIVVHEGETPFKPGPIIGELQKVGIPAAIQKGKIVVRKDTTVVKKGEVISRDLAQVLTKLEIYPLTVGLDLRAAYEDGMVFPKDVLEVDTEKVYGDLLNAIQSAINLSVNAAFPTGVTAPIIIANAHMKALNLAVNAGIVNRDTVELLLAKAYREMLSVAAKLVDGLDDELKSLISFSHTEVKEQEKEEENVEESKEEDEENKEEEAIAGLGSLFG